MERGNTILTNTNFLKLKKPGEDDLIEIGDINSNAETIDEQLQRISPTNTVTGTTISVSDACAPSWTVYNNGSSAATVTYTSPTAFTEEIAAGESSAFSQSSTNNITIALTATAEVTLEYCVHTETALKNINMSSENQKEYTGYASDRSADVQSKMVGNGCVYADTTSQFYGTINSSSTQKLLTYYNISGYDKLLYSRRLSTVENPSYGLVFYGASYNVLSSELVEGGATVAGWEDRVLRIPDGAMYIQSSAPASELQNFKVILIKSGLIDIEYINRITALETQMMDLQTAMLGSY